MFQSARHPRALSLRLEPVFAERLPALVAGIMVLATLSVIAATSAFSAQHAREVAVMRLR